MGNTQQIIIRPDGSVSGLLFKPGKGVDLRKLGAAAIKRITDIEWDGDAQAWCIRFLLGRLAGSRLSYEVMRMVGIPQEEAERMAEGQENILSQILFFADYDRAVKMEVDFIQHTRRRGFFAEVGDAS